jgi:hypothetical protein
MKKIFYLTFIALILCNTVLSIANAASGDPCGSGFSADTTCYKSLSPLQDPSTNEEPNRKNFPSYLQSLYRIGIGLCFVLGVIMFTWAGIEYIVSESMGGKSDAKARIKGALTGLAIALVSYILLNTINPKLLELTDLKEAINKSVTQQY